MKITTNAIEDRIVSEDYVFLKDLFPGKPELHRMTLCFLTLDNGFVSSGESSCVDFANFDADMGKKYARQDAFEKLWIPLGFELRTKLMEQKAEEPFA